MNSSMLNKWWWSISQQRVIDILLMSLNSVETHFPAVGQQMIWISVSTKKVSTLWIQLITVIYHLCRDLFLSLWHLIWQPCEFKTCGLFFCYFNSPQAYALSCSKAKSFTYFTPYISSFDTRCESNVLQLPNSAIAELVMQTLTDKIWCVTLVTWCELSGTCSFEYGNYVNLGKTLMSETLSCFSALGQTQVCLPGEETTVWIPKCFLLVFFQAKKKEKNNNREINVQTKEALARICSQQKHVFNFEIGDLWTKRNCTKQDSKWVSDSEWTSLWMQHITSADNKYSCQAADNEFHSTPNTQLLYSCEQITDPSKLMTPVWTVIISSNRLVVVMSLYILHKGDCIEANTLITEWAFISSDIQSLSSWHWPWE